MSDGPALNTDREIWREREGDYSADSIHVMADGSIGISCGGTVFVMPVRKWHGLATAPQVAGDAVALDEDEMPERIWAGDFDGQGFGHCVAGMQGGLYAEYVRADLAALASAPRDAEPVAAWDKLHTWLVHELHGLKPLDPEFLPKHTALRSVRTKMRELAPLAASSSSMAEGVEAGRRDIATRLSKLEQWAHEPFDFTSLLARIDALEQAGEAQVKQVVDFICDDVLPSYGIASEVGRADVELSTAVRASLSRKAADIGDPA